MGTPGLTTCPGASCPWGRLLQGGDRGWSRTLHPPQKVTPTHPKTPRMSPGSLGLTLVLSRWSVPVTVTSWSPAVTSLAVPGWVPATGGDTAGTESSRPGLPGGEGTLLCCHSEVGTGAIPSWVASGVCEGPWLSLSLQSRVSSVRSSSEISSTFLLVSAGDTGDRDRDIWGGAGPAAHPMALLCPRGQGHPWHRGTRASLRTEGTGPGR